MSKILTLNPNDLQHKFMFSKGNNRNTNSLDLRDSAGHKLQGKVRRKLLHALELQQLRYNNKRLEFHKLNDSEFIEKLNQIENNILKMSFTDKQAFLDSYYTTKYNEYLEIKDLNELALKEINQKELNFIQKKALQDAINKP